MITHVTSQTFKPLKTFPASEKRKTTLTSFDEILTNNENTTEYNSANVSVSSSDSENSSSYIESDSSSAASTVKTADDSLNQTDSSTTSVSSDVSSEFINPSTGTSVSYVDVAESKDDSSDSSTSGISSSSGVSTTTADSMKKTKYDSYFKEAAQKYDVSESLLKAIAKAESNFNANSVSSSGAVGVMQLMPSTTEGLGVKNSYDPEQNILGGAKCIASKISEYKGNLRLALAAYNAGSGTVNRCGGVPSQCKTYVNRVLSYKEAYETAQKV